MSRRAIPLVLAIVACWVLPSTASAVAVTGSALRGESGSTAWQGCDGVSQNVRISVDGGAPVGTSCNPLTGVYTFPTITLPASGRPIIVYLDSTEAKGVTYYLVGMGGALSGIDVVQDRVTLRGQAASNTVNRALLQAWDGPDTGGMVPVDATTASEVRAPGMEVHVGVNTILDLAEPMNATSIHVVNGGMLRPSPNWGDEIRLTGTGTSTACSEGPDVAMPLCIDVGGTLNRSGRELRVTHAPTSGSAYAINASITYTELSVEPTTSNAVIGTGAGQTLTVQNHFSANGKLSSDPWDANVVANYVTLDSGARWSGTGSFAITLAIMLNANGLLDLPGASLTIQGADSNNEFGPAAGDYDWRLGSLVLQASHLSHVYGTAGSTAVYDSGGTDTAGDVATDQNDRTYSVFTRPGTGTDWAIMRYTSTGVVDNTWGVSGLLHLDISGADVATSAAVDSSNRLLVGGTMGGSWQLRRYLPTGVLDTTFDGDGIWSPGTAGTIQAVTVTASGQIIAAGDNGVSWTVVQIADTGGSAISTGTWNGNMGGPAFNAVVGDICAPRWTNDDIYVVGTVGSAGARDWAVGKFHRTGSTYAWVPYLDGGTRPARMTMGATGGTNDFATTCGTAAGNDRLYVGGTVGNGTTTDDGQVRALETTNGAATGWWGVNGIQTFVVAGQDYLNDIVLTEFDMWVIGGDATSSGRTTVRYLDSDGAVDPTFGTGGVATWNGSNVERGVAGAVVGDYLNVLSSEGAGGANVAIQQFDRAGVLQNTSTSGTARIGMRSANGSSIRVLGDVTVGSNSVNTKTMLDLDIHDARLTVDGNFVMRPDGIVRATAANPLRVGGNLATLGTFYDGGGTVELWPRGDISTVDVSSTTQFRNLSVRATGVTATVVFDSTDALRVNGVLSVLGNNCAGVVRMRGSSATFPFDNTGGSVTSRYASVTGMNSTAARTFTDSHDGGSNTNVSFTGSACAASPTQAPDGMLVDGVRNARGVNGTPAPTATWTNHLGTNADRYDQYVFSSSGDGMQALWRLDGDGSDLSGNGRTMTPSAGSSYVTGKFGQSFSMPTRYSGASSPVMPDATEFTIDGWFKRGAFVAGDGPTPGLLYRGDFTLESYSLYFNKAGNSIAAGMTTDGGTYHEVATPAAGYLDNSWHHVAATYRNRVYRLYLDGELAATGYINGVRDTGAWNTCLGCDGAGEMDDWQVRSVAASADEIRGYYRTGRQHYDIVGSAVNQTMSSVANGASFTVPVLVTATDISRAGARYWPLTRVRLGGGAPSEYSRPDWFETAVDQMTVSLPDGAIQTLGAIIPGVDSRVQFGVGVTTNSTTGWSMYVSGESDTYALSNGLSGATSQIARRTTPAWPALTSGFAGMTVTAAPGTKDPALWGAGTDPAVFGSLLYRWPTRSTPQLVHRYTTRNPATTQVDVSVRVNPAAATRPGQYSGRLDFIAIPNV